MSFTFQVCLHFISLNISSSFSVITSLFSKCVHFPGLNEKIPIFWTFPIFDPIGTAQRSIPVSELMMGIGFYPPGCAAAGRLVWFGAFERVVH